MAQVNVLMCAGFSPCPAGAGLAKYIDELKTLDPDRTVVVEGCDGCCGTQTMMLYGVMPTRTVIIDKTASVDERSVAAAEAKILASLQEVGE